MHVAVITPERILQESQAEEVIIPTASGVIGVRKNHLPLIAPLKAGEVILKSSAGEDYFAVAGGYVEVLPDRVVILADSAAHAHELDELAIQEAIARAKEAKLNAQDAREFNDALGQLEMNFARLKVAGRKKSRKTYTPPSSD